MACPFAQPNSQVVRIAPFSQLIEPPTLPLSLQMKLKTAALHSEVERCLELPQKITTIYEYGRCLRHFYRLYQPLEASTNHFAEWSGLGLDMRERNLTSRLRKDLFALGISEVEMDLTAFDARKLSNFDYAFGVRYVIEGSTLGAQHILRHARAVLGKQIDGADSFFRGHESRTGAMWNDFRAALDSYGTRFPQCADGVIEGAMATFRAVLNGIEQ